MKKETKAEICLKRFQLLEKLKRHTHWLIYSDKPLAQKRAIWQKDFDCFVRELARQDKKLGLL